MTFIDEATVEFTSGRGGSGAVSFHREKFVPLGGPNGADGGRGGDVILLADKGRRTLFDVKLAGKFVAESGEHGVGNKRGRNGKSIEVKLPVGTVVTDSETGERVVDLRLHGMRHVICAGGKGGQGNLHFATSVRQAPNFAQKGAPGERILARLELKLIADVGLVGLPNAGKSTLISRISAARPKVADYPFTTIIPNLGVVKFHDETFVVADMPGLISGASSGVGLGHQFLRHVERNRVLVHVVDCFPIDDSDPIANYELIERELRLYSEEVSNLPRLIALNKIDLLDASAIRKLKGRLEETGRRVFPISGVSGAGLEELLRAIVEALNDAPAETPAVLAPLPRKTDDSWDVERLKDGFRVTGKRIERMVQMTQLDNDEGIRNLHRRFMRIGVIDKLREAGAAQGDTVRVGDVEFEFEDPR
ncbi:MAG TPA: GTPase ObgE [Fimbriimonadaceae bacterium]|nr:GTPase ObgE [Fimbriimonadaceae bacterium]